MLMGGQQGNNRHGYNSEILGEKRKTGFRTTESGELEKKKEEGEEGEKPPRENLPRRGVIALSYCGASMPGSLLCPYVNSFRTKIYTDTSKPAMRLNSSLSPSLSLALSPTPRPNRRNLEQTDETTTRRIRLFFENNFPLLPFSLYLSFYLSLHVQINRLEK